MSTPVHTIESSLDVKGIVTSRMTTSSGGFEIKNSSGTLIGELSLVDGGIMTLQQKQANQNLQLVDSTSFGITIDGTNHRVGIQTSSPAALFSVGSSSQFQVDGSGIVQAGQWNGTSIPANKLATHTSDHLLSGLADTTIATPQARHFLVYDGSDSWDNRIIESADLPDLSGLYSIVGHNHSGTYAPTSHALAYHSDYSEGTTAYRHVIIRNSGNDAWEHRLLVAGDIPSLDYAASSHNHGTGTQNYLVAWDATAGTIKNAPGTWFINTTSGLNSLCRGVAGSEDIYINTAGAAMRLTNNSDTDVTLLLATGASGSYIQGTDSAGDTQLALRAYAVANVQAYFTAGRVGVGTSNPTELFSVGSTSQFQVDSSGIVQSGQWAGTNIPTTKGGTGIGGGTPYTAGDILYASDGTTLAKLAPNTGTIKYLTMTSSVPAWSTAPGEGVGGSGTATYVPVWSTGGTGIEDSLMHQESSTEMRIALDNSTFSVYGHSTHPNSHVDLDVGSSGGFFSAYDNSGTLYCRIRGYAIDNVQAYFTGGRVGISTSAPAALLSVGSSSQFQVDGSGDIATTGTLGVGTNASPTANYVGVFRGDQNNYTRVWVDNDTGGTNASAGFEATSNSSGIVMIAHDDGYTTFSEMADKGAVYTQSSAAALALGTLVGKIEFYTGGLGSSSRAMVIDTNQKVGIGLDAPDYLLHVRGTTAVIKLQNATDLDSGVVLGATSTNGGYIQAFDTGGVENLLLRSYAGTGDVQAYFLAGRVSVGNSTPDKLFTVGSTNQFGVDSNGYLTCPSAVFSSRLGAPVDVTPANNGDIAVFDEPSDPQIRFKINGTVYKLVGSTI